MRWRRVLIVAGQIVVAFVVVAACFVAASRRTRPPTECPDALFGSATGRR